MISRTQAEAIELLAELCELSGDVRLGQLLAHIGFLGEDQTGRTLWDIDDEQLLSVLYHHRSELAGRTMEQRNVGDNFAGDAGAPAAPHDLTNVAIR